MKWFALFGAGLLLSGCSVDGQITDVTLRWTEPRVAQGVGLVSAAQQNFRSAGYTVSSSLGAAHTGIETTASGHTVYSSVQGIIVSETTVELAR